VNRGAAGFLTGIIVTGSAGAVLGMPVVMSAGSTFGTDYKAGTGPAAAATCGSSAKVDEVSRSTPKVSGFSNTQVGHAATIVRVGQEMKVPPRGWVVAVATAMQESTLRNLANGNDRWPAVKRISMSLPHDGVGGDHDSVGLFQQRPKEGDGGWGTVKELMTPATSAGKFYQALKKVDGWQQLPITRAAQKVQRSAYPSAYAKWEGKASALVDALSDGASRTPVDAPAVGKCAANTSVVASNGWVRPVNAPVGSGFRTASRPGHDGVDLSTRKGVKIYAVTAGTVVKMECDKHETGINCNRDGSPKTPGCGWHVYIRHAGKIVTHYCHMLRRPLVDVGDQVTAGQQIGVVGSSGSSSGPHLHFEVHVNGGMTDASAVEPVKFMRQRGAPLGEDNDT
jgi:murein DD-endopeptidase MepM/ murein hydrolase activator NlpD